MSARATQPACKDVMGWLKRNGLSLAPLTGTDLKALRAAVHIIELYAHTGEDALLEAFGDVVACMQPTTREYAYHAIAYVMEWDSRPRLWLQTNLPLPEPLHRLEGER